MRQEDARESEGKCVYECIVRPALLYGAESWETTKGQETRREINETRMLMLSCGLTRRDNIRNEYIRGTTRVALASNKVREKLFKWFGHVMRMKVKHIMVRRVLDVDIPVKRRRRPDQRLKDAGKGDMAEAGMEEDNTTHRAL